MCSLTRQRQGAKIVVVDPIRTETAEKADTHLAIRPGQDWALLLGMAKVIFDEGLEHREDCSAERRHEMCCRRIGLRSPALARDPHGALAVSA